VAMHTTLTLVDNVVLMIGAAPGLLAAHATHLSSADLLIIIQVSHSHVSEAGLNFVSSDEL